MNHDMHDTATNSGTYHNPTSSFAQQCCAIETGEMRKWAKNLKLNNPIPKDLLPLLAKDDAKQLEIVMKNMSLGKKEKLG
jgi:hypothetical protein